MFGKRLIDFIKSELNVLSEKDIIEALNFYLQNKELRSTVILPCGINNFTPINTQEILYIESQKKNRLELVTSNNTYSFCDDGSMIEKLVRDGMVKRVNYSTYINLNKVIKYNSYMNKIYFNDILCIDVTTAAMNNIIKKHVDSEYDLNKNMSMGHYLLRKN